MEQVIQLLNRYFMQAFPRIKEFNFYYQSLYTIPVAFVGRIDKIATAIYGNTRFYKPLAYANNIVLPIGSRVGVRPYEESLRNELILKGYKGIALEKELNAMILSTTDNEYDWKYYGDSTFGYISDLYEGRLLNVPTPTSAVSWLKTYEYL
jgi:hypothetical protein